MEPQWASAHFFIGKGVLPARLTQPSFMEPELSSKIHDIAARIAESEGMEVVEVEVRGAGGNRLIRVTIDKPTGVTLDDCELISNQLGTVLDVEDAVPGGSYKLEISSPGVERKLFRQKDFDRFVGEKVKVVLKQPRAGRKTFEGVLRSGAPGEVVVEVSPAMTIRARLEEIARANLKFDWR
ncbi:MAG: ribosome maturation factor RimP [Bryobacterales bacterium]|nr:ribosome maturation factor RimP [Bryobacterales bacterium]